MTVTDRTADSDAEFRSRIARFESAPTPPEVQEARVVEEVARALHGKTVTVVGYEARTTMTAVGPLGLESARDIAAAAVAAYRAAQDGGAEEAVRECGSRGPRIGSEGMPICRQSEGHAGPHRPAADDGWGDVTWSDFS